MKIARRKFVTRGAAVAGASATLHLMPLSVGRALGQSASTARRPWATRASSICEKSLKQVKGDKFTLSDFHERLLKVGRMPPSLMREGLMNTLSGGRAG
jgi:hypothetical protein